MPNHVTNIITFRNIPQTRIDEILEEIQNDEYGIGSIDFNKIKPMPEHIFRGNLGTEQRKKYGDNNWYDWATDSRNWNTKWNAYDFALYGKARQDSLQDFEEGIRENPFVIDLMKNFAEAGDVLSYEQAKETLQNEVDFGEVEYPQEYSANRIGFHTAWSAPHPVIEQLSRKYPEMQLYHRWADEDIGFNVGERTYENGKCLYENIPYGGTRESYELAAEIHNVELEDFGLKLSADESTYEFVDDEPEAEAEQEQTKIQVVLIRPMELAQIVEIDSGLESMQKAVGGMIEEIMPFDEEICLICNEEGKINGLELNRAIRCPDGQLMDIIAGDFFICSASGENFTGLADEQAQRYCEKFKYPERFIRTVNGIQAIQVMPVRNVDMER
ncbi:MAG: DUF3846 domain-containing protein [Saccharofermentanales bacterium]